MLAKVRSATIYGLEAIPIIVEVDVTQGLPGMVVVGLPDKSVEEAKERVRSAISNSGGRIPAKRIIVNLAPADVRKEGAGFDLPIALGILAAQEIIPQKSLDDAWVIGELALTGEIRHVPGILSIITKAKSCGIKNVILPAIDQFEVFIFKGVTIIPVSNLSELILHLKGEGEIKSNLPDKKLAITPPAYEYDFGFVKGQDNAKRALEIAAAGGHNVLLTGPPGSGKTLLARCLPSILPPMGEEERIEVSQIYSVAGLLLAGLMSERPYRNPHHTTSAIALVGGGSNPKPGEITLAHKGILFLDEFPEFPRSVLEALRQPMEDGFVTIARAQGTVKFPARFTLIAASNPCPCGYYTDPGRECICTASQLYQYQKKISGPILDRIDIHVEVPRISSETLTSEAVSGLSDDIRARVIQARLRQEKRYGSANTINASLSIKEYRSKIVLSSKVKKLLEQAGESLRLSGRAHSKVVKVAQTICDLEGSDEIKPEHIAEALQYRQKTNEH
jgi:magnesium chelatase family protein